MRDIINLRLFTVLLVMTVVFMSIFGFIRLYYSNKAFDSSLEAQINITAERISSAVKPSIWSIYSKSQERNFPEEFASALLDSELKSAYIEGVIVYGRFGHIYMGRYKTINDSIAVYSNDIRHTLENKSNLIKEYPIKFDSMTLGKVELFINTSQQEKEQYEALLFELIQIASVSFLFVILLFVAIKTSLKGPMSKLQVARKTFDNMGEAIAITDINGNIQDTNTSFNALMKTVEKSFILNIQSIFPGILDQFITVNKYSISWQDETNCYLSKNETIPVWLTITTVHEKNGKNDDLNYVFLFQDISRRKEAEEKLEKLAFYDSLTELANRQYFEKQLNNYIHDAHRLHEKLALIYIDLDNFKHVNDTLGHSSGDIVLIKIANRLKSRLRENDFIARLGGDEFVVIVRGFEDSILLSTLAESFNEIATRPIEIENIDFVAGASIGISIYPDDAQTATDLLKFADVAMYEAKERGRNQYAYYSSDLQQKAEHFFQLKRKMEAALTHQHFKLFYQPKVNLLTKKIESAEALIRWFDEGKIIRPDHFIPIAEETRKIIPIGYWVIETAIKQIADWAETKYKDISLSVNLSPLQLFDEGLITFINNTVNKYHIDPNKLEFEITETAILEDTEKVLPLLNNIKKLGIKISLDDFGTGYSSLSYLKELPIDILKIDRSFIQGARQGNTNGSILDLIIKLAHVLALDVVAEGIEDKHQVEFLISHNCFLAQGYFYSPPVPIEEFNTLEFREQARLIGLKTKPETG